MIFGSDPMQWISEISVVLNPAAELDTILDDLPAWQGVSCASAALGAVWTPSYPQPLNEKILRSP